MTTPIALVTGASAGLGRALTAALDRRGWRLVVDARDAARLSAAVAALSRPDLVTAVPGDVADPAHRRALADAVGDRLDLLVLNASTLGPSPLPRLADLPTEEFEAILRTNAVAPLALTQLLLPALRAAGGRVVAISSDAAVEAYEGWGGYGASKAALDQLAAVLGAEEPGLRVYAADPGDMRTEMHQDAFPGEDISDRPLPDASADAVVALVEGTAGSGRYAAGEVAVPEGVRR
jgi:NAD(P)-dependent dehydrogenase (short-subunit alcohol dehydrogenase family)